MTGAIGRRISHLLAAAAALTATLVLPAPVHADDGPSVTDPADSTYPALNLIGFSDAGFSVTDARRPGNSGFFQGQLVLHLTSALSSRVAFFSEVGLTASGDGSAASGGHYPAGAEVHRAVLKYTHSDPLKLSIGRFHTPVSYWNVTFHHGSWLQTTIARPKMLDFASPFVLLHFVGGFVEGDLPSGRANLRYSFGVGNGRGSGPGHAEGPADANNNRAWIARLSVRPEWLRGLEVGGSHYKDKFHTSGFDYRETIWNGYVAFTKERPELLAEYATVRHAPIGGSRAYTSWAYYAQVAWRLDGFSGKVKPYVRAEEIRLDRDDPFFAGVSGYRAVLGGVRFDASEFLALKAEYHRQGVGGPFRNGFLSQVSFTF